MTTNATAADPWRALPIFLALAFPLSWYPWVLALAAGHGNGGPNPLGLLLAALIAATVDRGWRGPVAILGGIIRLRAGPSLWLSALLMTPLVLALVLAVAAQQGIAIRPVPPDGMEMLDRFLIAFLFVALGEEPAWRGFLQPTLQRQLHPLAATLAIAVVWAFWHLPLLGTEFAWPLVPAFLVSVVAAAVVLAWLYNASRGSTLLPMIVHASINTLGAGYVFKFIGEGDLQRFWSINAGVWLALAVLVIVLTRGRLGADAS